MSGFDDLKPYLRPGDEKYLQGVDPMTGGMTLVLVAGIRQAIGALFGLPTARPVASGTDPNPTEETR